MHEPTPRAHDATRRANLRLAWGLALVALAFGTAFVLKIALFGPR